MNGFKKQAEAAYTVFMEADKVLSTRVVGFIEVTRPLYELLEAHGWKHATNKGDMLLLMKQVGNLTHKVVIKTKRDSSFTNGWRCKFSNCVLLGPKLNHRSGTHTHNAVLGEWNTLGGAVRGIVEKYNRSVADVKSALSEA